MSQRRLLPSTSMLAAFDAAARTGSFTAAARELSLTQGAISRQVCALEAQLGMNFFERTGQRVVLTEVGHAYAQEVRRGLDVIRSATLRAITNPTSGELKLSTLPTFGTRWLIPRMPSFTKLNPGITLNLGTHLKPFDFNEKPQHAAIHYGRDNWPGCEATFLMGEEVVPVCSASLWPSPDKAAIQDIQDIPLLHLESRRNAWAGWFKHFGLNISASGGMLFEQFSSVAQAAIAGLGAALLPKFLIRNELLNGSLVACEEGAIESQASYWLVIPDSATGYLPTVNFRKWLLSEISHYQK